MTDKKIKNSLYVNVSKKKRKEKAKENRGETFVGYRSAFFKDKTKYNRQKNKKIKMED